MSTLTSIDFLVDELRTARTSRGLNQDEFGTLIKFSSSHVSSVETGHRSPTQDYVTAVDNALKSGGIYARLLKRLIEDGMPIWLREWVEIEKEAKLLRWYEPAFIPGLLQTEAYARAMLVGARMPAEMVERRVAARMERQALLSRESPPRMTFIIDEMVIRRTVSREQPGIMAEQLLHLVACAELPHVQVLVVPGEVGIYPGLQGGFILVTAPDNTMTAHLDHQVRAQIVAGADELANLQGMWEAIHGEGLPRRQSLDLINEAVKTWT